MFGLYQNATGSKPSLRKGSIQDKEHGAQQVCIKIKDDADRRPPFLRRLNQKRRGERISLPRFVKFKSISAGSTEQLDLLHGSLFDCLLYGGHQVGLTHTGLIHLGSRLCKCCVDIGEDVDLGVRSHFISPKY